jgi:hypothetical protein
MHSFTQQTYLKIVRASGVYDVLMTAAFATPWTFALLLSHLSAVNQLLGGAPLPGFGPFQVLVACLLGSVVMVWSVLRIVEPRVLLGRFDGAARFLFSTWMAWTLFVTGAPVLWLFVIPELMWGVVQWLPVEPTLRAGRRAVAQPESACVA